MLASLYGKQVQCSVDSVIRKHCVSEIGVRIYLRKHERNTVAHSGIGKPEQPVVTCDVLCDCIQSLEEGIEEDARIASVEREHALGNAFVLLIATDVLRNPVPEDAVLDVAPGLLLVRVYRVVHNTELCERICNVLSLICFRVPVANEREPDSCSHYLQRGAQSAHQYSYLLCDRLACYSCTPYRYSLEHCSWNKHALFELRSRNKVELVVFVYVPLVARRCDECSAGLEDDLAELALFLRNSGDNIAHLVHSFTAVAVTACKIYGADMSHSLCRDDVRVSVFVYNKYRCIRMQTAHQQTHRLDA